jgi:hypothetical protein
MSPILNAMRDLVVVNSNQHALRMSIAMRDGPAEERQRAYAGNNEAGHLYMYRTGQLPGFVMETVFSPTHKDGVTTVYKEHRAFESGAELLRKRDLLIKELSKEFGLSAEAIGIPDQARRRDLSLTELATGQLVDLLQDRTRAGIVMLKTDNYATGVDKAVR